jgi:hypothetical protein
VAGKATFLIICRRRPFITADNCSRRNFQLSFAAKAVVIIVDKLVTCYKLHEHEHNTDKRNAQFFKTSYKVINR